MVGHVLLHTPVDSVESLSDQLRVLINAAFGAFAAQVQAEHGVCDVMVDNAGIGSFGEVVTTTETEWDRIVGINLLGVVHGTRLFAQQMVDAGKRGHIVNVASAAAFVALPNLASYSTTKYAAHPRSDDY